MAVYSLSPMYQPQYVAASSTVLTFATPSTPTVVPASYNYQIAVARVANITSSPVSLKVWRVPSGASADNAHIVVPEINIPVATNTFPYFDLTTIWGIVLKPGDSIWAIAGAASSLVIHADGAVVTI